MKMKTRRLEKKNMDVCKNCKNFLIDEEKKCTCTNIFRGGGSPIRVPWASLNGKGVWERLTIDEFERASFLILDYDKCLNCK